MKKSIDQESGIPVIDESSGTDSADKNMKMPFIESELEKRRRLLNIPTDPIDEDQPVISEWTSASEVQRRKPSPLIANLIPASDLLIFELNAEQAAVKTRWNHLPLRLKEVFEEIVYSLPLDQESGRNDDGCYTFSYADDEYNLSVISIVIKGKAALFYKNN